jgi:predicted ester cyclase
LTVELSDQFGPEDRVVSRWSASGTHSGPLNMPAGVLPPTGGRIAFDEFRIDRHAGGLLVEAWFMPDRMTLWQ